jgi:hypothetical protein
VPEFGVIVAVAIVVGVGVIVPEFGVLVGVGVTRGGGLSPHPVAKKTKKISNIK